MSIDQERLGGMFKTDDDGVQANPKRKMPISAQKQNFDIVPFINEIGNRVNSKSTSFFDLLEERLSRSYPN
jgi:hypothetical protein